MTHIAVIAPPPVSVPRGAVLGAAVFLKLLAALADLAHGHRERTAADARSRDALAVRLYANRVAESDPGFAADLRAAADRHDG